MIDKKPPLPSAPLPPAGEKKKARAEKAVRPPLADKFRGPKEAFLNFWKDDAPQIDRVADEARALAQYRALLRRVTAQAFVIMGLLIAVIVLMPVLKPIYLYETLSSDKKSQNLNQILIPLDMPNLTDQAILSWAATSITEVMTFGFGDFDQRMLSQRPLFTSEGWDAFTKAIREQNMRANFKQSQLVLTSIPANAPVIIGKGVDEKGLYKWLIEMPLVMTYTTNNNVTTQQRGIAQLTVTRVPSSENVSGVGIKGWKIL